MPVVTTINKVLLDSANGTRDDNVELPDDLQVFTN